MPIIFVNSNDGFLFYWIRNTLAKKKLGFIGDHKLACPKKFCIDKYILEWNDKRKVLKAKVNR